jgi:hypothetical protein
MSEGTRSVSAKPVTEFPADSIGLFGTTSSTLANIVPGRRGPVAGPDPRIGKA